MDEDYINTLTYESTRNFYKVNLYKIAKFSSIILESISTLVFNNKSDCYKILLKPEYDITKVLLYPHKAVITALREENIDSLSKEDVENKIKDLIITIKHRILHSIGMIHKYYYKSVMANYENNFQKNNLFFYLQEDYESINKCYGDLDNPKPFDYTMDRDNFEKEEFYEYIYQFDIFLKRFKSYKKININFN